MKFIFCFCMLFSTFIAAELTIFDLEGIPALWGQGQISPFDGLSALPELENYRILPENYGPPKAPYPCHYQSWRINENDCPQSWPAAVLQFLFPVPFVPNQATMYDPLNHVKLPNLAKLLRTVAHAQATIATIATDYAAFTKARADIISSVYPIQKNKLYVPAMREEVDKAFTNLAREMSPLLFLKNFHEAEAKIRKTVVPNENTSKAKRLADHFLSRSIAENFANAVLGTLMLAEEDGKSYYRNFVTKALYAYFSAMAESRDDVLEFYELFHRQSLNESIWTSQKSSIMLSAFIEAHRIPGELDARNMTYHPEFIAKNPRHWLQEQYNDGFGRPENIAKFMSDAFAPSDSIPSLGNPDELAILLALADSSQMTLPPVMRYKTATVSNPHNIKESVTHSDCGETTLRYLIGLACYNNVLRVYDPAMWDERVRHFKLKPYPGIADYFSEGPAQKRSPRGDQRSSSHNKFSQLVTSNLNRPGAFGDDVLYTKPRTQPFTEINPGIDNIINVIQRLFGDEVDEEEYSASAFVEQVSAGRATLSLRTLHLLRKATLASSDEAEHNRITGQFRKYQMNRFFKLISPIAGRRIGWLTQTPHNELPNNFETLYLYDLDQDLQWELAEDHFDLYVAKGANYTHRFAYLKDQLLAKLMEARAHNPAQRSNLHRLLLDSEKLPEDAKTIAMLKQAFVHEPELVYLFPLRRTTDRWNVAKWILRHDIEILYDRVAAWLGTVSDKNGWECEIRAEMGELFEDFLTRDKSVSQAAQRLIDRVIMTLDKPLILAFGGNSSNKKSIRYELFKHILAVKRNESWIHQNFFYVHGCGIKPALQVARTGHYEAFKYFQERFSGYGHDWLKSDALHEAINSYQSPPMQQLNSEWNRRGEGSRIIDTGPLIMSLFADESVTSHDLLTIKYGNKKRARRNSAHSGATILHKIVQNIANNSPRSAAPPNREHWPLLLELLASGKLTRRHFLATNYQGDTVLHTIAKSQLGELLNFVRDLGYFKKRDFEIRNDDGLTVYEAYEMSRY